MLSGTVASLMLLALCSQDASDGAGVAVTEMTSTAPATALEWTIEPAWQIGGTDTGPGAFFRVDGGAVDADAEGRLYVLDQGNHEVRVFGLDGTHLRSFGREGDGPGELKFPFAIAVSDQGVANIVDFGKGAVVRFDAEGLPLPSVSLSSPYLLSPALAGDRLIGIVQHPSVAGESARQELVAVTETGSVVLATLAQSAAVDADLGCTRLGGLRPLFDIELHVAVLPSGKIVLSRTVDYRLDILEPDGRNRTVLTRDEPTVRATAKLAEQELARARLSFPAPGGRDCVVDAADVVEARGFAPVVPAVRGLVAVSDGSWWVERGVGHERYFDVFTASGNYAGTLPVGTPRPAAFLNESLYVVVEYDALGRVVIVAYRIRR